MVYVSKKMHAGDILQKMTYALRPRWILFPKYYKDNRKKLINDIDELKNKSDIQDLDIK